MFLFLKVFGRILTKVINMSEIKVKEYLKKYNMDQRIIRTDKSSATVKEAAEAFNT